MQYDADNTGKCSAVDLKSGEPVYPSGPGLKRPTPAVTAGRKPETCPSLLQPKKGRGAGWNPALCAGSEAPVLDALSDLDFAALRQFFELLDRWDRESQSM